jgi:hypothetical protein
VNHQILNDLFKGTEQTPLNTGGTQGSIAIGNGNSYVTVEFPFTLAGNWHPIYLNVINTTDPSPLNIFPGIITAQSATGFTVQLNAAVDSANYLLSWGVALN